MKTIKEKKSDCCNAPYKYKTMEYGNGLRGSNVCIACENPCEIVELFTEQKPTCNVKWPHANVKGLNCACYRVSWWRRLLGKILN